MNTLKRVLFVDDSPSILSSMEAVLRKDRQRWDMVFALGGERAIGELRRSPFDVVVSDMRMPDVDGAAVLQAAKDESPASVRIILTGYASNEAITTLLPSLHRLLVKPCDTTTLRGVLERSLAGLDLERDANIRRIVASVDRLPSPPELYFELSRLMQSPTAGVREIADVVARDPALTARVLQLANSSYFVAGPATKSITQAVSALGMEQLRCLALTTSVLNAPKGGTPPGFSVDELQQRSIHVGSLARAFAEPAQRDEAFAAGLLHQVGQLVLALATGQHAELRARLLRGEAELDVFGATHTDVGARLLAMWGLPLSIVDAVQFQHDPGSAPEATRTLASIVHVASAVASAGRTPVDVASLERAGCLHLAERWQAQASTPGRP